MENNQLYSITNHNLKDDIWKVKINNGVRFFEVIKSLHQLAKENQKTIYFEFNGNGRTMPPNYPLRDEWVNYGVEINKLIEEKIYMKEFIYESKEEITKKIEKVLKNFDKAFESEETLVKWLGELAEASRREKVRYDHEELAKRIEENQKKYSFDYNFNENFTFAVASNKQGMTKKQLFAMYVIGNVYNSLKEENGITYKNKIYNIAQRYNDLVEQEYFATTKNVLSVQEKSIDTWKVSIELGAGLDDVLKQSIKMATKQNVNIELIFNEIPFKINDESTLESLQQYYSEEFEKLHTPKEIEAENKEEVVNNKTEVLDKIQEARKKSKLANIVDKIKNVFE